jgi:hypothetical protein
MKNLQAKYIFMKSFSYAVICGMLFSSALTGCKSKDAPTPVNEVEKLANNINFKCPFMVDEDTRMDSVNILPDSTFQYNYTLVKQTRDNIDIRGLTNYLGPRIQGTAQTSSGMELHRAYELRLVFYYRDKNGDFVTQIVLEPEDY